MKIFKLNPALGKVTTVTLNCITVALRLNMSLFGKAVEIRILIPSRDWQDWA
jgi:hypothetical protein